MEKFLDEYMKHNKSTSKHTRTAMLGNLRRLEKLTGKDFDEITTDDLENPDEMVGLLRSNYSLSTTISTILTIKHILKMHKSKLAVMDEYDKVLAEMVKLRTEENHDQTKNEKEQENWIEWPELQKKVTDLAPQFLEGKKKPFTTFRNFLLMSLFALQPPSRIGNYIDMHVRDQSKMKRAGTSLNKNHNYIIREGDKGFKFIFNKYKTAKSVGQLEHNVDNPILADLLARWFDDYNKKGKIFLVNTVGKPMDQSAITNALKSTSTKHLGKSLTLNSFRHIFLTHYLASNPTIEDKKKTLTLVGHKYVPSTAEQYTRI
jgi:integrase